MKRVPYHLAVAAATFFLLFSFAGTRSAQTLFIVPLRHEFGLPAEAVISAAIALGIALGGISAPFMTAVNERWGMRRTVVAVLLLSGISSALSTLISSPFQLIPLWGLGMGLSMGNVATLIGTRWFAARRGLVFGVFSAAGASGALLFLPLFGNLIQTHGWQYCAWIIAFVSLLAAAVFGIVVRERPSDIGLLPFGSSHAEAVQQPSAINNPVRRALSELRFCLTSRSFWILSGTFFICGASTNGLIGVHLIPACGDYGIPETRAAGLLAAMGVFDVLGTTASGWLSDRVNNSTLLFWYYGLRGLSLLFLPWAFGAQFLALPVFAVFYGLDWVATVPPTLKLTIKAFGAQRAPVIFAWILAAHQLGASFAAFTAGLVRVTFGSYQGAFISSGILCLGAAALMLRMAQRQQTSTITLVAEGT